MRVGEYSSGKAEIESSGNHNSLRGNNSRLFRGDLVEFRILLDRRTKQKYARHIKLIQSDRERKRNEKEKKLLESATIEEGIIVSLNNGFGFIKSNKRRDDVYFHYSHVIKPGEDSATASQDNNGSGENEFVLKKGQEVKFLVVTEPQPERQNNKSNEQQSSNSSNSNDKVSARQIKCLPAGSVVFHTVEAQGVKGTVTMVPQPPSSGSKIDDSKMGKIRLNEFLNSSQTESGEEKSYGGNGATVEDVLLHYAVAPGGVFTYQNHRNQSVSALWIHEGDTLLFDVIKETIDGSYRAVPTLHTIGLGGSILKPNHNHDNGKARSIS